MITLTTAGLHIDNSCFGSGMLLTRVTPYKAYQDGKPLNDVAGYKYAVVLPSRAYEMLAARVSLSRLTICGFGPISILNGTPWPLRHRQMAFIRLTASTDPHRLPWPGRLGDGRPPQADCRPRPLGAVWKVW